VRGNVASEHQLTKASFIPVHLSEVFVSYSPVPPKHIVVTH
jgi:hypothetical protein